MVEKGRTDAAHKREMITFPVGGQEYCVDMRFVHPICQWRPLIHLLHAPRFICGMLQIGDSILPTIDVAARLRLPTTEPTKRHIILLVEIAHQKVGLLAEGGCQRY